MSNRILRPFCVMLLATCLVAAAFAQSTYPARPIRVIVPYPAGGVVDLFARALTDALSKRWSQPIIVDVRPGASTNIGTMAALQSEADGYTWLMAGPGLTANPSLFANVGWNPMKDFAGVGVAGYSPLVLVVNDRFPARTLRELAELAKLKPGAISAGTMNGSSGHFIIEALKRAADVDFLLVPYKGAPPIVADLINGVVQVTTLPLTLAQPHVQSGRIRALAVAASARSSLFPDVPTFAEAGFADGALIPWYGIVVPRATPQTIVKQINAQIILVLKSPEVRERILKLGGEPAPAMTPAEIDLLIESDFVKYGALIKRGNIKPE